jgi:hypothetical protein
VSTGYLTSQFANDDGLIDWLTIGQVSHVDLVMPSGELLGARFKGGVQVRPADYRKFKLIIRLKVWVPNVEDGYAFALAQVGKPYDSSAIIDMALHRMRPMPVNPLKWYCSELNDRIIFNAGTQLLRIAPDIETPEEEMSSPVWEAA